MRQSTPSAIQQHQSGSSSPACTRKKTAPLVVLLEPSKSCTQTEPTRWLMLNRLPHLVRCTPLITAPKAAATKKTPNIRPPAAGFHFTPAESASASSADILPSTYSTREKGRAR